MKQMKKSLQFFLVMVMVLCMSITAFAAGEGSITLQNATTGNTYKVYRIFDLNDSYSINADWAGFFNGAGAAFLSDTNASNNLNQIKVGDELKYINITDANVVDFARAAMGEIGTKTEAASQTATSATVAFTGLDLGYYIVSSESDSGAETYVCICSLTNTEMAKEASLKVSTPLIEKTDNKVSADVGETIQYTITGAVPKTEAFKTANKTYIYRIKDTLSDGLTLNGDVAVTVGGVAVTDATIEYANNGFTLTIPVMDKAEGAEIKVTYSAVINEKAVAETEQNKATLTYSNDPFSDTLEESLPEIEQVYSAKIIIDKVDGKTGSKLEGAEFVLKNSAGAFYFWNANDKKVSWEANQTNATVIRTSAGGAASFDGLANGVYYLVETKAPAGYNLLTEPVEISVNGENPNEEDPSVYKLVFTSQVENNTGDPLPETGGIGTIIFYVLGALLVVGGSVVLIARKRMEKENSL